MSKLLVDEPRVLQAIYEWRFVGHLRFVGEGRPRVRTPLDGVPHYLLFAQFHPLRDAAVQKCLDGLVKRGSLQELGRADMDGTWTLPSGREIRVTTEGSDCDRRYYRVQIIIRDPRRGGECGKFYDGHEPCGRMYYLTPAGLESAQAGATEDSEDEAEGNKAAPEQ